MGIVKAYMMEMEERGYGGSDDHVCTACVTDEYPADWVTAHAEGKACSFCDAESAQPIAAPFEAFTEMVLGGLGFDWNEPTNEGSRGAWHQGKVRGAWHPRRNPASHAARLAPLFLQARPLRAFA